MSGRNVNPFAPPSKVPFVKTVTTSQRGVGQTSSQVNDPAWLKYTQNVGDGLTASVNQITVLNNAVAALTASFATISNIGAILPCFVVPGGDWRFCDGAAISRTTYATLFALIGTTFGAGDGSTTFNIPTCSPPGGATGLSFCIRFQ